MIQHLAERLHTDSELLHILILIIGLQPEDRNVKLFRRLFDIWQLKVVFDLTLEDMTYDTVGTELIDEVQEVRI